MPSVLAVVEEAAHDLVRREADRARRAATSPEKLAAWMADFYPRQGDYAVKVLGHTMHLHTVLVGRPADTEQEIRALIARYVTASTEALTALTAAPPADLQGRRRHPHESVGNRAPRRPGHGAPPGGPERCRRLIPPSRSGSSKAARPWKAPRNARSSGGMRSSSTSRPWSSPTGWAAASRKSSGPKQWRAPLPRRSISAPSSTTIRAGCSAGSPRAPSAPPWTAGAPRGDRSGSRDCGSR